MAVKVGVIGTGWTDRVQIPAFQAGGLEVLAVASRDLDRARVVAGRHGVEHAVGDWRELLDMPIDIISVTSPPRLHVEQASAALQAGKHVLCEKPLGLDTEQVQHLAAVAEQHPDQFAWVDHQLRFTPVRSKAKELIDAGALGDVLMVTARVATDARVDPSKPWSWWSDVRQGGGILNAIGSHVIDGIHWLLDAQADVQGATLGRVAASRQDSEGQPKEVTADDIASVTFAVGGAVGTMLAHGAALDDPLDLLTLRGTNGTLVVDRSLKLYFGKRGGPLKEYRTQPLPPIVPNRFRASPYAAGTVLMADAMRRHFDEGDGSALAHAATVADGLAVQRVLDQARAKSLLL